ELAKRRQLRLFSKDVKSRDVIQRISFESFDNSVAPTLIAVTAELAPTIDTKGASNSGGGGDERARADRDTVSRGSGSAAGAAASDSATGNAVLAATTTASRDNPKIRTLIIGAGSSHDFNRWFLEEDSKILAAVGDIQTTAQPDD